MPKHWYDYRAIEKPTSDDPAELERYELNKRIVADKKPYFMRYIYPLLMKEHKSFVKQCNFKALMAFGMDVDGLRQIPKDGLTQDQADFLDYFARKMPVGVYDCTMNRICRRVEERVDAIKDEIAERTFDFSILRYGREYKKSEYIAVKKLYDLHCKKLRALALRHQNSHISKDDYSCYRMTMIARFVRDTLCICNNSRQLCDIVLDMCYGAGTTKQFAWDAVGNYIVEGLVSRNEHGFSYPAPDPEGDIEYCGQRFSMKKMDGDFFADHFGRAGLGGGHGAESEAWGSAGDDVEGVCDADEYSGVRQAVDSQDA